MKLCGLEIEIPPEGRRCLPGHEVILLAEAVEARAGQRIAELGSAVGALSLLLASRLDVEVVGFELQEPLVEAARRSASVNRARLQGRVRFEIMDIRRLGGTPWEGRFDHVVANPPFYRARQGRLSPQAERAAARHELQATLADFVRAAAVLLRARGRFHCVIRADRLDDLLMHAIERRCPIKQIRPVYTRQASPAKWMIAVAVKGGQRGLTVAPPLELWRRG